MIDRVMMAQATPVVPETPTPAERIEAIVELVIAIILRILESVMS